MMVKETSVLFDWDQHQVYGPFPIPAVETNPDLRPATTSHNVSQRCIGRSPHCGVFSYHRNDFGNPNTLNSSLNNKVAVGLHSNPEMLVHWYIESQANSLVPGFSSSSMFSSKSTGKLDLHSQPCLTFVFPRGMCNSLQNSWSEIATDPPAIRVSFSFPGVSDLHFITCSSVPNASRDTFEAVVLTSTCELVAIQFSLSVLSSRETNSQLYPLVSSENVHERQLPSRCPVEYVHCSTLIAEMRDSMQAPVKVLCHGSNLFVFTDKDVVRSFSYGTEWENLIKGPRRGIGT
jgi:hypothetical protein